MTHALIWAAGGTGFTCFMTALGSATVFLFRSRVNRQLHQLLLGFAAGVMIAASMWSLLIPAIEAAEEAGLPGWFPAAGGSVLGVLFLVTMNTLLPHLTPAFLQAPRDGSGRRSTLLVLAIAMHNIPEGMAVGISFALAARSDPTLLPAAMALALGIGIQNFPEGAAISLPLRQAGMSRKKILPHRRGLRGGGAHRRPVHRPGGGDGGAADALAPLLCRDALSQSGGGAHPRGQPAP